MKNLHGGGNIHLDALESCFSPAKYFIRWALFHVPSQVVSCTFQEQGAFVLVITQFICVSWVRFLPEIGVHSMIISIWSALHDWDVALPVLYADSCVCMRWVLAWSVVLQYAWLQRFLCTLSLQMYFLDASCPVMPVLLKYSYLVRKDLGYDWDSGRNAMALVHMTTVYS